MAFTDPGFVSGIIDRLLSEVDAALTAAGRPTGRVHRFPGIPSWDCQGLYGWPQLRVGGPGTQTDGRQQRQQRRHILDVNVLLLRCVTTITDSGIPAVAVVDADGDGYATDMWVLERAMSAAVRNGDLIPDTCTVGRVNPVTPQSPSGGLSGMLTSLEIGLG